jgi:hypothetical protein
MFVFKLFEVDFADQFRKTGYEGKPWGIIALAPKGVKLYFCTKLSIK